MMQLKRWLPSNLPLLSYGQLKVLQEFQEEFPESILQYILINCKIEFSTMSLILVGKTVTIIMIMTRKEFLL